MKALNRQMRRTAERQIAKRKTNQLENNYSELVRMVSEMQVAMNTVYQLLIQKDIFTTGEFSAKHKEIITAMYPPKPKKKGKIDNDHENPEQDSPSQSTDQQQEEVIA